MGVENGARVMPVLGLRVHTYCAPCRSSTVQLSSAKSSRDSSVSSVPPTSRRRHAASRHACITRRRTQSHAATRTAIAHRSGRSRLGRGQGTLAVEGRYGSTSAHSSNSCITAARTPQDNTLAGGRGAKEGAPQASAAKGEKWGRRELRWPTSGRCSHSTRRHCACSVPILSRVVQRTTCTLLKVNGNIPHHPRLPQQSAMKPSAVAQARPPATARQTVRGLWQVEDGTGGSHGTGGPAPLRGRGTESTGQWVGNGNVPSCTNEGNPREVQGVAQGASAHS